MLIEISETKSDNEPLVRKRRFSSPVIDDRFAFYDRCLKNLLTPTTHQRHATRQVSNSTWTDTHNKHFEMCKYTYWTNSNTQIYTSQIFRISNPYSYQQCATCL